MKIKQCSVGLTKYKTKSCPHEEGNRKEIPGIKGFRNRSLNFSF